MIIGYWSKKREPWKLGSASKLIFKVCETTYQSPWHVRLMVGSNLGFVPAVRIAELWMQVSTLSAEYAFRDTAPFVPY
jgi:hypothetical protein